VRIAIAEVCQETDTFSPVLTGLRDFEDCGLFFGDEVIQQQQGVGALGGFLTAAEAEGAELDVVPILRGWAMPGGRISASALEFIETQLVAGLRQALPVDGVFLSLHGAAASEKTDDVEGYLLAAVRKVIGKTVPVVVPLDHHANVTRLMIDLADILVAHETQPHLPSATGKKAAQLLFDLVKGRIAPAVGWCKIPMITPQDQFLTSGGPMQGWFDAARAMERRPGVIAVSTFPMQPWLDVAEAGWAVVVYADRDLALARELAAQLADQAWQLRAEFWVSGRMSPAEAIRCAATAPSGLMIVSDTGDSVYGGATGDNTCLLEEILRRWTGCPALVPMVDPEAVEQALAIGIGNPLGMAVGGEWDTIFTHPVQVTGRVAAISRGLRVRLPEYGLCDLGRTVVLEVGRIALVLAEKRSFALNHPIMYTHLGLDPAQAQLVVVKTASNFQFFAPWRKGLVRADSPGLTQSDLRQFSWMHAPRPLYGLDDLPEWQPRA
jgi:microcystin degradation protein MlrC